MKNKYLEILIASTKLGLTSFGGPTAHLGYFREEYVNKRKWLDDKLYAEIVALCQFLPGPASSQVGISIGLLRGGIFGGFLSWFGFTMPSVLLLMLFAMVMSTGTFAVEWIQGLKIVAVAVVAHALLGMQKTLAPDRIRISFAIVCAILTLLIPTALGQVLVIASAGVFGYFFFKREEMKYTSGITLHISRKVGVVSLLFFILLLILLPLIRQITHSFYFAIFDTYYRVGAMVFGGGHVVLPMLQREVDIAPDLFLAGYGAAQAVPGPLFTLSSYLGWMAGGTLGVIIAVIAMFLPSFLLVIGILPFWSSIRSKKGVRAALKGVNAAVVGILLAALYDPVFTSAVNSTADFIIVLITFTLLVVYKWTPIKVVFVSAILGILMHII